MKKSLLFMMSLSASLAVSAAEITQLQVVQLWPWSGKVAVDYTVSGCVDGKTYDVVLKVTDPLGNDVTGLSAAQSGDVEYVGNGNHTLMWNPSAATEGEIAPMLKYELSLREPIGRKYLVITFARGEGDVYDEDLQYEVSYADELDIASDMATYRKDKIAFRRCRAGSYMMGSPEDEPGREGDRPSLKETLHKVTLTNDFYLAVFPVTGAQAWHLWGATNVTSVSQKFYCDSKNLVRYRRGESGGWPADSSVDETSFIGMARGHVPSGLPEGYVIDLPTEAQWEYACRAGTDTAWNNGQDPDYYDTYGQGQYGKPDGEVALENGSDHVLDQLGQYMGNDGRWRQNRPASNYEPGRFLPNAWGFYDMHGGVGEMCVDYMSWDTNDDLGSEDAVEPRCTDGSLVSFNIFRGGGAFWSASKNRSAARIYQEVTATGANNIGARLAIVRAE